MYSTIYNKDKAKRLPHSTLDVERSMFDVQIVASEITTEPSYHIEITYTGQEFWIYLCLLELNKHVVGNNQTMVRMILAGLPATMV